MRQMYPDHAERIVNDAGNRTIFDVLRKAHNDGYANVRVLLVVVIVLKSMRS